MSTGDRLQLQLYKMSETIRVIDLHLVSIQEVKKQMFYLISLICHENKLKYWVKHFIAKRTEVSGLLLEKMNSSMRFICHQ